MKYEKKSTSICVGHLLQKLLAIATLAIMAIKGKTTMPVPNSFAMSNIVSVLLLTTISMGGKDILGKPGSMCPK